jgi:Fur family transcriptional regulator, ferric uptake regulator
MKVSIALDEGMAMTNPLIQRLKDEGHKLTHARLTVLDVIERNGGHLTSTELLEKVNAVDESIGRASVFRALDLFTRLAIVRPTYIEGSATAIYVLMHDGHHHHIICTRCNAVIEFEDCQLHTLQRELEERFKVQLSGHLLEFYGTCATCTKQPIDRE